MALLLNVIGFVCLFIGAVFIGRAVVTPGTHSVEGLTFLAMAGVMRLKAESIKRGE